MLNIRLQRTGKRGQAYFRIIIAEHTKKPKGGVLELLGHYDPHKKELKVEKDRIEYWMSKGAQISPTVNNLLVNNKVWDRPKMESWKPKPKEAAAAPAPALAASPAPAKKEAPAPEEKAPEAPAEETPAA
jgi:small subunit ribosomal protein S16